MLSNLLNASAGTQKTSNKNRGSKQQTSLPSIKISNNKQSKQHIDKNNNRSSVPQLELHESTKRSGNIGHSKRDVQSKINSKRDITTLRTRDEYYDEVSNPCVLSWKNDEMTHKSRLGIVLATLHRLRLNLKATDEHIPNEKEQYKFFGFEFTPNENSAVKRYNELIKMMKIFQDGMIECQQYFEKGEYWLMFENLKHLDKVVQVLNIITQYQNFIKCYLTLQYELGEYDRCILTCNYLTNFASVKKDKICQLVSNDFKSRCFEKKCCQKIALKYAFKKLKLALVLRYYQIELDTYEFIGILYYNSNDIEKSKYYHKKAIEGKFEAEDSQLRIADDFFKDREYKSKYKRKGLGGEGGEDDKYDFFSKNDYLVAQERSDSEDEQNNEQFDHGGSSTKNKTEFKMIDKKTKPLISNYYDVRCDHRKNEYEGTQILPMKMATEVPGRARFTVYKDRAVGHMIIADDIFDKKQHELLSNGRHYCFQYPKIGNKTQASANRTLNVQNGNCHLKYPSKHYRFEKYSNWTKEMDLVKISTSLQFFVDEQSKANRYLGYIKLSCVKN